MVCGNNRQEAMTILRWLEEETSGKQLRQPESINKERIPGKADRVPVQFESCRQLTDHFSKELGIPAHYTENHYEDVTYRISANELRTAMGSDVVVTSASVADDYKIEPDENGQWLNEY